MDDQIPASDAFSTPPVPGTAPATPAPADATGGAVVERRAPWKLVAVAAVAVAAVVVGVVVVTGGDDSDGGAAGGSGTGQVDGGGEWHLARYVSNDDTATIEVLAADLSVATSVQLTTDGVPALALALGRWLTTDAESGEIEVLDLAEGTSTTVPLPADNLDPDRPMLAAGSGQVVYFSGAGGPLVLVDLAGAEARAIGSNERGYFPVAPRSGVSLYMAIDGSSTVVVPHDEPSAWWEVPGPVADVRGRETLTLGLLDDEYVVRRFDGEEQQGKTVVSSVPQYGGLLTDTGAMTVDTGGALWTVDFAAGDYDPLGTLGVGVDGAVPIGADRLLAWGGSGTRVIDAAGNVVREIDPLPAANGELQSLLPLSGAIGSKCLTLQPGPQPVPDNANAITVDLATEKELVRFDGTPFGFTLDGCSAISLADPQELMLGGTLVDLGLGRVQAFSPDLDQVVGVVLGGEPEYFLVDVASGERTVLPAGGYFWARF
jgi:hypothetical protein